jgi:hypothetical protein
MTAVTAEPRRLQLSRRKGWRLPPGAMSVARPTKWGNPFRVRGAADGWTVYDDGTGKVVARAASKEAATRQAVILFRQALLAGQLAVSVADARRELRGRVLACWCAEDAEWCHADVWLAVANTQRPGER